MARRGSADRYSCLPSSSSGHPSGRDLWSGDTSWAGFFAVSMLLLVMVPLLLPLVVIEVGSDALADGTWLAALYNATNGPSSWSSGCRTNWNITNPGSVCSASWSGVTCSSGVVTYVNLSGCNLRGGPLPDIQGTSLSSLQHLDMGSNSLTGTIPPSFGNLSSLQYLSLYSNSLTGTLLPSFGNLSSLQTLYLDSNNLTGTLPPSWYILRPSSVRGIPCYYLSDNYLTGDIPSSWLWSNATIRGYYFTGNCLNVSNMAAVSATGRWFDTSGTPRSNASLCAAVAAAQAAAAQVPTRRTRSLSVSVSATGTTDDGSASVSTSVPSSATVSVGWSGGVMIIAARHPVTESLLSSPSPPVPSATASVSSSDCEERAVCWARLQATTNTTATCHGCTFLDPGPATPFRAASSGGTVVFAQVSREALDTTTASLGSLQVAVECTRPRFLRLANRSTATLDVVVAATVAEGGGGEGRLAVLQLSLPRQQSGDGGGGGWLRWSTQQQQQQSPYRPFTMELPLAGECGDRSVTVALVVLVTPVPLPQLAVGGAVQATDRATTWLGAVGGGASGGGSASRMAAVRSLLMCSKEGASTGGLLGLSLPRPSDDGNDDGVLLASARGAIVGNTLVLVVWLVVLLVLAGVYHRRVSLPAAAAARAGTSPGLAACVVRVALPSSLLPVCSALLPSLSGGVLILAAVGGTQLDAVDILVLFVGCYVLVVVLAPLLWLCAPSFATGTLNTAIVCVDWRNAAADALKETHPSLWLRVKTAAALLWRRAVRPRWVWRPCPGWGPKSEENRHTLSIEPLCDSSLAARGCDVILEEHRCLWYAALDMWSLCATGLLGAASGVMDSSSVCSGAAIALTALFLLQLAVVVVVRPLTSVFANVHAAFVLLLTGLGTALQAASIAGRGGSTSRSSFEDWSLLGAAVCGFLVAGASLMRVALMDAPHTVGVIRKFFLELASGGGQTGLAVVEEDQLKCFCLRQPTSQKEEEECNTLDDAVCVEAVDALNRDFWDDVTGEVRLLKQDDISNDDASMDELLGGDGGGDEMCEEVGGEALLLRFRV